ncbi:MAG: aromatic ring-hydroxylating dioxygenase subunit alpha [SAR324 cluster bacterium]|nr:aromatic ring-hydroxylating dioxygenase subunit alpha [SAR324 cluster bacterium]
MDIDQLVKNRQKGYSLPQAFYNHPEVFKRDMERVFRKEWLLAGAGQQIPEHGDFMTFNVAGDSIIITRGKDREIRAFHNVCRHRGARICLKAKGNAKNLACPYHQWVYNLEGKLVSARIIEKEEGFNKDAYSLKRVHVKMLCDLIYICLTENPPDFEGTKSAIEPQLSWHQPEKTKVCYQHEFDVKANWKLVLENNRECYHCATVHKQFMKANYDLRLFEDEYKDRQKNYYEKWEKLGIPTQAITFPGESSYRCERLILKEGFATETLSGEPSAPLLGKLPEADTGSVRCITLPNAWYHANCDYIMLSYVMPVDSGHTKVRVIYLVHEDAVENQDYVIEDVTAVWNATSEQDQFVCEAVQAGVNSSFYEPGPFSKLVEGWVEDFVQWYLKRVGSASVPG